MEQMIAFAEANGWEARRRTKFRAWFTKGEYSIDYVRSLYRHSSGRAYRGNALSGVFTRQRDIKAYMEAVR